MMEFYLGEGGPAISENRDEGLTVRDYFAAKAMQAIETPNIWDRARQAYELADAMMNIRSEKN